MKIITLFFSLLLLFSCSNNEKKSSKETYKNLNATIYFQVDNINSKYYYLDIKGTDEHQIAEYPEDSIKNGEYKFESLKGGEYTLSFKSYFGESHDTIIHIEDSLSTVSIKNVPFKKYIDSFDIDTFLNEINNADSLYCIQESIGCFNYSKSIFNLDFKKKKYTYYFEKKAYSGFFNTINYKKILIKFIKNIEHPYVSEEGIEIWTSTSYMSLTINIGNKVYNLNTQTIWNESELDFSFLDFFSSYNIIGRERAKQYLPLKTTNYKGKVFFLQEQVGLYDKKLNVINDYFVEYYDTSFTIDSITRNKISFPDTLGDCNKYNFIHLNSESVKGWVSGKGIYEFNKTGRDTSFSLQDIDFKINVTQGFGVGVTDEDGLTFCSSENPVVLYNSKYNREDLVFIDSKFRFDYPTYYLTLDESDSWYDEITRIKYQNDSLTLNVRREYQEGYEDFIFLIKIDSTQTKGKIIFSKFYP